MPNFIPKKPEKEIISIRIPKDILEILDGKAAKSDMSRNELINQCILFALDNMEQEEKE